jgi:hypothetical protein
MFFLIWGQLGEKIIPPICLGRATHFPNCHKPLNLLVYAIMLYVAMLSQDKQSATLLI